MHLNGLAWFLVFFLGGARRRTRINEFRDDAQRQDSTLANQLDVSAKAREALIPEVSGTRVVRRTGPQAGSLRERPKPDGRHAGYLECLISSSMEGAHSRECCRRQLLSGGLSVASACLFGLPKDVFAAEASKAELRDERRLRAEAAAAAAANPRPAPLVSPTRGTAASPTAPTSDEFTVEFEPSKPLGLKLKDLRVGFEYGTREGTSRVLVANVEPGGQAAATNRIDLDFIIVAVNGVNVEKESAKSVQDRLAKAKVDGRGIQVTFRDPFAFSERLETMFAKSGQAMDPIATKIAPENQKEAEQVLSVRRIEVPESCTRNAQAGDLVEIRYVGRLADGTVFDGMELGSRLGDDSIQFVLGRQPAGQFPPAWDVGLVGMCVGERRELDVPPVLGYGAKGLPKRGVPPNARLLYDVELLAINALAIP